MQTARASIIGRARPHLLTVWQPPAALNHQSDKILHFPSALSQRVFAINLQHIPIILLFHSTIIHFFNIINTPTMIPNNNPLKIQHDSSPYPQECNQHHQTAVAQPGNARLYAKTGHWSDDQKLRYLMFIDYHELRLRVRQGRRQWRLFRAMSAFIRTRKPNQCRSHHAKMESYFEDIAAVIDYLKARIPNYRNHYSQALSELQQIAIGPNCHTSQGYIQEESLSNNESQSRMVPVIAAKRTRGSRTSIRLAEDEGGLDFRDKNLPKTDNSLNNILQTNPSVNPQRHPSKFCASGSGELLHCAASNYFQLPNFGLLPFHSMQEERMSNFFEYYQHRSMSLCELNEWIECQRLYLLWRNRVQRLVNH